MLRSLGVLGVALALAPIASAAIVFSSDRSSELDAPQRYAVPANGGAPRPIPPAPAGTLSPDGTGSAILAVADGELRLSITSRASGVARVVVRVPVVSPGGARRGPVDVVWSPDSRRLAFTDFLGCERFSTLAQTGCGTYELWTVDAGGGAPTLVGRGRRPSWAPDSQRLAFVAYYDPYSRDSVFVARADGTGVRVLGPGAFAVWAPHANPIAYVGPRGVTIVHPATRRKRALGPATPGRAPLWSPDGTRVAFYATSKRRPALVVADVRSGRTRVVALGRTPDATLALAAWSPDGRRLAFVGPTRTYTDGDASHVHTYSGASQVLVVGADGGHVQQVTREAPWALFLELRWAARGRTLVYTVEQLQNDAELYRLDSGGTATQLTENLADDFQPSVSPDGSRILFFRRAVSPVEPVEPALYVLDLATDDERRLPLGLGPDPVEVDPAWSPDGAGFAFVDGAALGFARADGTLVRTVATLGAPAHPSWSPDGTRLAFSDRAPGAANAVFAIGADGTALRQVTTFEFAREPAWSPDGRWIAFFGDPGNGPSGLWVVHPDGSDVRAVRTFAGVGVGAPAWSPDSSRLVYAVTTDVDRTTTALHEVALDGSGDTVLDSAIGTTRDPVWQP